MGGGGERNAGQDSAQMACFAFQRIAQDNGGEAVRLSGLGHGVKRHHWRGNEVKTRIGEGFRAFHRGRFKLRLGGGG